MPRKNAHSITIKDIAKMAGVSVATVSYVMNGKGNISEDTAALIKKIIKETGYSPNLNSRRLVSGKSFNIHVVTNKDEPKVCNMFYYEVLLEINKLLSECEYNITVSSQSEKNSNTGIINNIKNKNVDGLLFFENVAPDIKAELKKAGVPYVLINPCYSDTEEYSVRLDFSELAFKAVSYLIECGHKKIAFIGMKEKQHFFENMLKGYSGALKENALAINENYIFDNVTDENSAECAVEKLIKLDDPPTAVFCSQDPFAISGMKKARELGLSLPDDLSFFGLDDIEYSKYVHPALSTIHISRSGLANAAVGILLDLINGKEACAVKLETADISKRASVKVLTKKKQKYR